MDRGARVTIASSGPIGLAAFVTSLASAWFMTGLIWLVQVVHYPLFAQVGREGFAGYESAHARLITPIVAPVMLAELASALVLLALRPRAMPAWAAWTGAALVIAIWASTFLMQVPAHGALSRGFDTETHARLVSGNWIRTVAWSLRAVLLAWVAWSMLVGTVTTASGDSAS
jgi:uncharacterized membrane protein